MILSLSPTLGACVAPSGLTPDRDSAETAPARPRRAGRSAAREPSPRVPGAAVPASASAPFPAGSRSSFISNYAAVHIIDLEATNVEWKGKETRGGEEELRFA